MTKRKSTTRLVEIDTDTAHALIRADAEDWQLIAQVQRYLQVRKEYIIAVVVSIDGTLTSLPRLLMNAPHGMDVHHKDGDPLNNRKTNLVVVPRKMHIILDELRRGVEYPPDPWPYNLHWHPRPIDLARKTQRSGE